METAESYRRHAEEAERVAREAKTPMEREAYEKIAQGWRDLAEQAERRR